MNLYYEDVETNIVLMRVLNSPISESNIVCIAFDDSLIFIDTTSRSEYAVKFRFDMEKRFNKKTQFLFLTHAHSDHFFGISAFEDVPIIISKRGSIFLSKQIQNEYSPEKRLEQIEKMRELDKKGKMRPIPDEWKEKVYENLLNARLFEPKMAVDKELIIKDENHKLLFKVVGGHTPCSSYLYYYNEKILITGDNLNSDHYESSQCMLSQMNKRNICVLEQFEKMNISKIIPGHGHIVDMEYLKKTKNYIKTIFNKLEEFKTQNIDAEKVVKNLMKLDFIESKKPKNLEKVMLRWYNELHS